MAAVLLAALLLIHYISNISGAYAQNSTSTETSSEDAQSQATENTEYGSLPANSTSTESSPIPSNSTETSYNDTADASYNNTSSEPEDQGQASATTNSTSSNSQSEEPTDNVGNGTQTYSTNSNQTQTAGNSTYTANESTNSTDTGQAYQNSTSSSADPPSETTQQSANATETSSNYHNTTSSDVTSQENVQTANGTQMTNGNITSTSNATTTTTNSTFLTQSQVHLPPPDFDIDMDPVMAEIDAGSAATFTITITSINGFDSDVLLVIKSASPEITATLSSNMTRPPTNASSTLFLTVQSDASTPDGKYKVKVAASAANITDSKSVSAVIEVTGSNQTSEPEFDPVALTPILIRNLQDDIVDNISSNEMVLLSTTLVNNYDRAQPFVAIIEVRDKIDGTTLYLQLQKGILNPSGEVEIATSWIPGKKGTYEVRSFVIDKLGDPQPLSAIVGRTIAIETVGSSGTDFMGGVFGR